MIVLDEVMIMEICVNNECDVVCFDIVNIVLNYELIGSFYDYRESYLCMEN